MKMYLLVTLVLPRLAQLIDANKERLILAHGFRRSQFIMVEKARWEPVAEVSPMTVNRGDRVGLEPGGR